MNRPRDRASTKGLLPRMEARRWADGGVYPLDVIEPLRRDFDVGEYGALSHDGERFALLAIRSRGWREELPILVVTGGVLMARFLARKDGMDEAQARVWRRAAERLRTELHKQLSRSRSSLGEIGALSLGIAGTLTALANAVDLKTAARTALTLTTPLLAGAGQNLRATIAYTVANATAGKARLRVMYTIDGRSSENQIA